MSWIRYAANRVMVSAVILFVASIVIFMIVRLIPGDPAQIIQGQAATESSLEAMRRQLGLHRPAHVQYFHWINDILTLDWGQSLINGQSIWLLLKQRYPRSLQIALMSMVLAILIGFPLAIKGAVNRNTTSDYIALFFSQAGVSIPNFWLGILLIWVFARMLNLLPPSGFSPLSDGVIANLERTIMPVTTLGLINAAIITRYLRSELLEQLNHDYVRTAKAFGHPQKRIIRKYVLKNALIPTITVIGIQFGGLIGGIVIVEKVFAYPGIGTLILGSILNRDYPVVQITLLVMAATFIAVNLVVDLLYGKLNPKIQH